MYSFQDSPRFLLPRLLLPLLRLDAAVVDFIDRLGASFAARRPLAGDAGAFAAWQLFSFSCESVTHERCDLEAH